MRTLISLFFISGLLAVALFVAPAVIDWNSYRGDLSRYVQAELGVSPIISGDLTIELLPQPRLRAEQVKLRFAGENDGAGTESLDLAALSARFDPTALLVGQLRFDQIKLDRPRLILSAAAADRWPSLLAEIFSGAAGASPVLSKLTIRDGTVISPMVAGDSPPVVGTDSQQTLILDALNGALSRDQSSGIVRFKGGFRFQNQAVSLSGSVGGGRRKNRAVVAITGSVADDLLRFQGNGFVHLADDLSGSLQLSLDGDDSQRIVSNLAVIGVPLEVEKLLSNAPLKASADLSLSPTDLRVSNIVMQVDQMRLTGDLAADRLGQNRRQWRGKLAFNRLDLNVIETAFQSPQSWRQQLANMMADVSFLAPQIQGQLQVSVGILAWRGRLLRELKFSVLNGSEGLQITDAMVNLPGGAAIGFDGRLVGDPRNRQILGHLDFTSTNFRSILSWLGHDLGLLPANRLRQVKTDLAFTLTPEWVQVRDWSFEIDGSRGNGGLTLLLQERPSFGLSLAAETLNLGHYFADPEALALALLMATGGPSKAVNNPKEWAASVARFDSNIDIQIENLSAWQHTARGVNLRLETTEGAVSIAKAHAEDVIGAAVTVDGKVAFTAGEPQLALNFDITSQQSNRWAALLDAGVTQKTANRLRTVMARGRLSGPLSDLAVVATVDAAGGRIDLTMPVDAGSRRLAAPAEVNFEHPEISSVVDLLLPGRDISRQLLGPGQLSLQLAPVAVDQLAISLNVQAIDAELTATGHVTPYQDVPAVDLAVVFNHPDAVTFIRRLLPQYVPQTRESQAISMRGDLSGNSSAVTIDKLRIDVGAGQLKGEINYRVGAVRPQFKFDLLARNLRPLAWILLGKGAGEDVLLADLKPLDLSAISSFDSELVMNVESLWIADTELQNGVIEADLRAGTLDFQIRDVSIGAGNASVSGQLVGRTLPALSVQVSGKSIDIDGLDLSADFGVLSGQGDIDFRARTVGETWRDMRSNLSGSGHIELADITVHGFDLSAMTEAVSAPKGGAAEFVTAAQRALTQGSTDFNTVKTNITIKDGVLRANDIQLEGDAAIGRAAIAVSLPAAEIDLKMRLRLKHLGDVPTFDMRLTGPLTQPRRMMALDALRDYVLRQGG
jgi:uncharacterized protein involved in outer membrane biogenesis